MIVIPTIWADNENRIVSEHRIIYTKLYPTILHSIFYLQKRIVLKVIVFESGIVWMWLVVQYASSMIKFLIYFLPSHYNYAPRI